MSKLPIFTPLRRCDHDLGIAVEDRLVAERDRAQPGAAELIDAPGRALDRDAGRDRGLPGRVLALPGGQDLPQDHFRHLGAFDAGALERLADGDLAQFMGRQACEGPVEGAHGRAHRADDDDIVFHVETPFLVRLNGGWIRFTRWRHGSAGGGASEVPAPISPSLIARV
jgi:hypothetical protein